MQENQDGGVIISSNIKKTTELFGLFGSDIKKIDNIANFNPISDDVSAPEMSTLEQIKIQRGKKLGLIR